MVNLFELLQALGWYCRIDIDNRDSIAAALLSAKRHMGNIDIFITEETTYVPN